MEFFTFWMKALKAFSFFDVWNKVRHTKTLFSILILSVLMIPAFQSNLYSQTNIKGVAPLKDPNGGLAIDGNAYIGMPGDNPDAGDWLFPFGFDPIDPLAEDPGAVFPPSASDAIANGIPDQPIPDSFYNYPDQTTFFRDNITNNDPTIFTSSNKINDDPNTYTWGTGSSPNKNEIQNAIAHFSFADPSLQYGVDGDLWLAFAADRQVTNGSSYIDFEILQAPLTLQPGGTVQSLGPDGGRTLGDILVTIEFTQGGGHASVVTRRWVSDGSGGFIYEIFTPDPGTVFGTENDVMTIVPFSIYFQDPIEIDVNEDGTLDEGFYQYSINQWAEGAVNVTSFFPEDACITLSTLFVRTRTSGSSSQSELKDFPGPPIQIQIDLTPEAPELTDVEACDSWDDALTASGCEGTVKWYDAAEGGSLLYTGASYSPGEITETTSFWASCTVDECEGPRAMVTVTIYNSPDFDVTNLEDCEATNTGAQSFDLNDAISNEEAGSLTFYMSATDAQNATNSIGDPSSVSVSLVDSPKTFWARLDNDNDGDSNCHTIKSFTVTVYDNPDLTVQDLENCEDGITGSQSFDLNDAVTDADGGSVSFYTSEADANAASNAISSPYSVNVGTVTLWARSDNDADGDEGCYSTASFDVTVYDNPDFDVTDLASCQSAEAETANFDLNDAISNADAGSLSFYNSEADALVPQNPIGDPTSVNVGESGDTFWARLDNDSDGEENCYTIKSFDVSVYDNPDITVQDLADCEDGETGAQTFDLNDGVTNADGGSVSFYASEADALVPQNAIGSPGSYSVSIGTETIWVRSDNQSDGDETCFGLESFSITVYDNPDVTATDPDTICYGDSVDLATYVSADGGNVSFHLSQADADNDANPLLSSVVSPEVGTTTYYVRSETVNGEYICFGTAMINVTVEQCAEEGCTLGYWKNHTDKWCEAYSTCDLYGDIFENAPSELSNLSLLEVLNIGGGGIYNLGRQSVAALLNTCSSGVDFAYSDIQTLIDDVNSAFANDQAGYFGSYLDMLNQAGCPLSGSNATTASSPGCPEGVPASTLAVESGFSVSPVPFKDNITVKYNFNYTSNVNIQFFNLNGQMLQNFKFQNVTSGMTNELHLGFAVRANQFYVIKVNTDRESFSKTIIASE